MCVKARRAVARPPRCAAGDRVPGKGARLQFQFRIKSAEGMLLRMPPFNEHRMALPWTKAMVGTCSEHLSASKVYAALTTTQAVPQHHPDRHGAHWPYVRLSQSQRRVELQPKLPRDRGGVELPARPGASVSGSSIVSCEESEWRRDLIRSRERLAVNPPFRGWHLVATASLHH